MAQFKCKPSSNIWQDFSNHLMSLWSETRKRRQSILSASRSLTETHLAHLPLIVNVCVFNLKRISYVYNLLVATWWPLSIKLRWIVTLHYFRIPTRHMSHQLEPKLQIKIEETPKNLINEYNIYYCTCTIATKY